MADPEILERGWLSKDPYHIAGIIKEGGAWKGDVPPPAQSTEAKNSLTIFHLDFHALNSDNVHTVHVLLSFV